MLDLLHYLWVENVATQSRSPWRPLRIPLFRNLLIADLVSDIGTFMQSVGAAWLMTSLTTSPMYVALIQTASALPFFVLALPAGSIGDIFDRRKLILRTEMWMLGMAIVLAATTITHTMTPWLLLLLTFGLSAGDAIHQPGYRWSCTLVCIRIRSISAGEKRIAEAPQLCDTSIYEGLRATLMHGGGGGFRGRSLLESP